MKAANLRQRIERLTEAASQKKPDIYTERPSLAGMTVHEASEAYRTFCNQGSGVSMCDFPEARMTAEEAAAAYRKFMA